MKKITALLMALIVTLGIATSAFANGVQSPSFQNKIPKHYSGMWKDNGYTLLIKDGKVIGGQPEVVDLAVKTLNKSGWNLKSAYNWCLKNITYTRKNQDNNGTLGIEKYAINGFKNKKGNCWTFASCLYYMGKLLGEDIHVVHGSVPYANGKNGPHAWNEVIRNGKTYVIDADFELTRKKNGKTPSNGYLFAYKTKGTWKYKNIERVI